MRNQLDLEFRADGRTVKVRATDSVGPEDCYENAIASVLHRYVTGEDLTMPVPREIKDWIIRTSLTV